MVSMLINGFGVTLAGMMFPRAKLKPILSKPIMLNCDITWLVLHAVRIVFRVALMLLNVPYACLSILSIAANCTNANIPSLLCQYY